MKRRALIFALAVVSLVSVARGASAQLLAAKDGPIVYGHHHLSTANIEAQKKFLVDTLGGILFITLDRSISITPTKEHSCISNRA